MKLQFKLTIVFSLVFISAFFSAPGAKAEDLKAIEAPADGPQAREPAAAAVSSDTLDLVLPSSDAKPSNFDPLKYTLGPDDVVEISVMRHPEFSGVYPINQEGKLQYKFVGDIEVRGLTKLQLEQKVKEVISSFVIAPEINVTITEYKSKIYYVLGEVGAPGKYYMRSESIPVREAVFQAGLPTQAAAMRNCQIITPAKGGNINIRKVNVYSLLYGGELVRNIDLRPGDVLYVPSTVMAKIIRVINPVASTIGVASSGPESVSSGRTAVNTLAK